jgi:hypothetical protein
MLAKAPAKAGIQRKEGLGLPLVLSVDEERLG